jgi:hypothetical protein
MRDWGLFLSLGASIAAPTRLLDFSKLAESALGGIGWRRADREWTHTGHAGLPSFTHPGDVAPKVLFGTLREFGIEFVQELAGRLGSGQPNAAHRVAAKVLAAGGLVWTTNVDRAIEGARECDGFAPPRYGRSGSRPVPHVLASLCETLFVRLV